MIRLAIKLTSVAVTLVMVYLAVTFVQVALASRRDEARQVQAIVVFGAAQYNGRPSPVLRARLDHAADLYEQGLAGRAVVTGGKQEGDRLTEAAVSAAYLSSRGVPDSAILREVSGRSSWQQLAAAANFLKQRDISRVLLVSDGFHSARIAAMADELGLTGFTSPTTSSPIKGLSVIPYLGKETVAVAAGRVVGFRRMAGIDRTVGRARAQAQAAPASLNNRHSGVV